MDGDQIILDCAGVRDTTVYLCKCGGMVGLRFKGWLPGSISKDAKHPGYFGDRDNFRSWYIHKVYALLETTGHGGLMLDWLRYNGELHKYFTAGGAMIVQALDNDEQLYKGRVVVHK
jgi:hypothetical protein